MCARAYGKAAPGLPSTAPFSACGAVSLPVASAIYGRNYGETLPFVSLEKRFYPSVCCEFYNRIIVEARRVTSHLAGLSTASLKLSQHFGQYACGPAESKRAIHERPVI